MRRTAAMTLALVSATAAIAGCAASGSAAAPQTASSSSSAPGARPSRFTTITMIPAGSPNPQAAIPDPGTGTGDPRLVRALLPQSSSGRLRAFLLPPAVVAMPVRDRGSLFIPLRQSVDPVTGPPACGGWTAGLWFEVVTTFNVPGVQLAVTQHFGPEPAGWPEFSEAIITGPSPVLDSLAGPAPPAGCRTIAGQAGYAGGVRALAAARIGLAEQAYEVTGTGEVPVWVWAEVVHGPGFVLEVRIPRQATSAGSDPGASLGNITAAAYQRALTTLGARS